MFRNRTSPIKDGKGSPVKGSSATLETVKINGMDQTILIRGHNPNHPILLFLQGGPGRAQIGFAKHYQVELEKHFIVVNWDQRGSGKTFSPLTSPKSMNIEQFILDTHSLIQYLLAKFGQKKVFLVGHSWGSVIGMLVAKRYPHLLHAYIGAGQMIQPEGGQTLSYRFLLISAHQRKEQTALQELDKIGYPPYRQPTDLFIHEKWLEKLGGLIHNSNFSKILGKGIFSPEYTIADWVRYIRGRKFSTTTLGWELFKVNLFKEINELPLPIYLFVGRSDYQSPTEIQEKFYKQVKSPHKEWIWFERSAHAPHFEEPTAFLTNCLRIRDELTMPKSHKQRSLLYV